MIDLYIKISELEKENNKLREEMKKGRYDFIPFSSARYSSLSESEKEAYRKELDDCFLLRSHKLMQKRMDEIDKMIKSCSSCFQLKKDNDNKLLESYKKEIND